MSRSTPKHGDTRVISVRGAREHALRQRRLCISLIPKPLYGRNLRKKFGDYRWRKLRKSLLPGVLKCQTCGVSVVKTSELKAHEEWSYSKKNGRGVAKLTNIHFLCVTCHRCQHFGLTIILAFKNIITQAQVEDVIRHYCRVNRVSRRIFIQDFREADAQWKQRSKLRWKIDWGSFAAPIDEKTKYLAKPSSKLFLDPRTDSEPSETSVFPKRGPRPLFGRAMTRAEQAKRHRYLKKQRELDYQDILEMNAVPAVWVD